MPRKHPSGYRGNCRDNLSPFKGKLHAQLINFIHHLNTMHQ